MNCPKCGSKSIVRSSRTDSKTVHRRRKCTACETVFYTKECVVASCYEFNEVEKKYAWGLLAKKQNSI